MDYVFSVFNIFYKKYINDIIQKHSLKIKCRSYIARCKSVPGSYLTVDYVTFVCTFFSIIKTSCIRSSFFNEIPHDSCHNDSIKSQNFQTKNKYHKISKQNFILNRKTLRKVIRNKIYIKYIII